MVWREKQELDKGVSSSLDHYDLRLPIFYAGDALLAIVVADIAPPVKGVFGPALNQNCRSSQDPFHIAQ